jgi:hypothetical protein
MLLFAGLCTQIISPEDMVGYSEQSKGSQITKVFEDAYKSPLSIVILVSGHLQPPSTTFQWQRRLLA